MIKAVKLSTTGAVTELDLTNDALKPLQKAVGGCVEAINLANDMTIWCNEEGKLNGLPHNPYAQYLWDAAFGQHTDYIVGDIVLTGGVDEDGETIGLDEWQVEVIGRVISAVDSYVCQKFVLIGTEETK